MHARERERESGGGRAHFSTNKRKIQHFYARGKRSSVVANFEKKKSNLSVSLHANKAAMKNTIRYQTLLSSCREKTFPWWQNYLWISRLDRRFIRWLLGGEEGEEEGRRREV